MKSVKPFAISSVIDGGMASSVRLTTASIRTGPSWASAAAMPVPDLGWVFEPHAADADGFGHRREIRVLEFRAEIEEAGGLLLQLDEAERAVVEHHHLHRKPVAAPA